MCSELCEGRVNASSQKLKASRVGASADEARVGECEMEGPRKSYEHEPYARMVSGRDSLVQPRMKQSELDNFPGI